MRIGRLAGLMSAVIATMGLGAASTAWAGENPLFRPAEKQGVSGEGGGSVLFGGGRLIVCAKNRFSGTVSNTLLIGNITFHYLNCVSLASPTADEHCTVNSIGATGGLILTRTLHAVLGLILPSRRTGLLFLPVAGATVASIEANNCTVASLVTGNVVAEVEPVGAAVLRGGKLFFTLNAGVASVKDFDLTHGLGLVEPELEAFGEPAALSQAEEFEYTVATEIT